MWKSTVLHKLTQMQKKNHLDMIKSAWVICFKGIHRFLSLQMRTSTIKCESVQKSLWLTGDQAPDRVLNCMLQSSIDLWCLFHSSSLIVSCCPSAALTPPSYHMCCLYTFVISVYLLWLHLWDFPETRPGWRLPLGLKQQLGGLVMAT